MENWMKIGKGLEELLRPQTYPLAVKLVKDESEFPEKTRRFDAKVAVCQAFTVARRYGWTVGLTGEESECIAANIAYGWTDMPDESYMVKFYLKGGYVADEEGAKTIIQNIDRLEPGEYCGMVISPLTRTKIVPDVILVYGNSAQILRLIQGAMYRKGEKVKAELSGIGGACISGVIRAFKSDEYQVVVPANGERTFALNTNDEMIFAIPASRAVEIVNNMQKQRFAKYPIPVRMQMPPQFPEAE
jgi:uncharacterized protein (DUF169 family)